MPVDSFKFLPRSFRAGFESVPMQAKEHVWAPLSKPVEEATIALLTSAGLFIQGKQEPFDTVRELGEPLWGDPTYRVIRRDVAQADIDAAHLHLNTRDFLIDLNVALPIRAFAALEAEGKIGRLADDNYSFMGFQEAGASEWRTRYGPEVAMRLQESAIDVLMLAPA